jgi:XTP/dITP diphosphohydrolase
VRITFLRTSPRVAPGLLTRDAWRTLDEAGWILTDDPSTAEALGAQGIEVELVEDVPGALRQGAGRPVVVLGAAEPETPAGAELTTLAAAYDVPGSSFVELVAVMDRLRTDCPWDQEQTHRSLAKYLLEETYETLEAIESGDVDHLREELGDLLLQVCFHSRIAAERGSDGFDVDDVARGIAEKLVYRHPHVFAGLQVADAAEVDRNWDALKAAEKKRDSPLDGIPRAMPALAYADKVLGRLRKTGMLDGTTPTALPAHDLGGRLLELVREARDKGLDPEQELREAVARLIASTPLDQR